MTDSCWSRHQGLTISPSHFKTPVSETQRSGGRLAARTALSHTLVRVAVLYYTALKNTEERLPMQILTRPRLQSTRGTMNIDFHSCQEHLYLSQTVSRIPVHTAPRQFHKQRVWCIANGIQIFDA